MSKPDELPPTPGPYEMFRVRVIWNNRYVAGFARTGALPQKADRTGYRKSGCPPPALGPEGQGTCYCISLERGTTFDLGFEQWVSRVRWYGPATGKGSLLPEYKRPFTIDICDENGEVE